MNNLTQAELDQLMNTSSTGGSGSGADLSGGNDGSSAMTPAELKLLTDVFTGISENQAPLMSSYITAGAGIRNLTVSTMTKDAFMQNLPMEVLCINYNYSGGLAGDHYFAISSDDGKRLAEPIMGMPEIDMDGAAISAIAELFNSMASSAVETLSEKAGSDVNLSQTEGEIIPKASLPFSSDPALVVQYVVDIVNDGNASVYEVFDLNIARKLLASLAPAAPMGGMDQPFMPQGVPGGMANPQQYQQYQQQQMYGQPQMGMPQQGYPGMMPMQQMPQQNVQSVQFSDFKSPSVQSENKKYGILMDVYMELTVELGRTKKMVKEILSMGEGTIIELDKLAGEPVDILVNHNLLARGEVVVIGDNFGVRVSEIISKDDKSED